MLISGAFEFLLKYKLVGFISNNRLIMENSTPFSSHVCGTQRQQQEVDKGVKNKGRFNLGMYSMFSDTCNYI